MTAVIAHRGARSLAPENTLAAARIACELGADLWETDVSMTKEGHLILFHDPTLDRCTDVASVFPGRPSTRVIDYTLNEILRLDAGSYFVRTDPFGQIKDGSVTPEMLAAFKGEKIPTLEQCLDLVTETDWQVNLELKSHDSDSADVTIPDRTVETIRKSGICPDRIRISSFNHDWLLRVQKKEPALRVQALVGYDGHTPLDFGDLSFDTYNANADLITDGQIRMLQSKGKSVNLFTVNDPKRFHHFATLGVDGIFTDFPQTFVTHG